MNIKTRFWFSVTFASISLIIIYCITKFVLPEDEFLLTLGCGILCYLFMFLWLYFENKTLQKKYNAFVDFYKIEPFLTAEATLVTQRENRYCKMYFCDEGLYFASLDKKPHIKLFLNIKTCKEIVIAQTTMHIINEYNETYYFHISNSSEINDALKNKKWIES